MTNRLKIPKGLFGGVKFPQEEGPAVIHRKNNRAALQRRDCATLFSVVFLREFAEVFFHPALLVSVLFRIPYGSFFFKAFRLGAFSQISWVDTAIRLSGSTHFSTSCVLRVASFSDEYFFCSVSLLLFFLALRTASF